MVSFSCEACGDVLTKKKLDPHRNQCRGASFTCLDCMVHFHGTEYRAHTSCISEAQKYQGALYRDPSSNKKQRKSMNGNGRQDNSQAMVPRNAYVEDAPEDGEGREVAVIDVPPRAPTPPPADRALPEGVNVFDFLVTDATPDGTRRELEAPAHNGHHTERHDMRYTNGGAESQYSQYSNGDGTQFSQYGYSYGHAPVQPNMERYDSWQDMSQQSQGALMPPPPPYVTPGTNRHERSEKKGKSSKGEKSDKKRKRGHVEELDLSASKRPSSRGGDTAMTDAAHAVSSSGGRVLHSGLTGGLSRLVTDPEFYEDRIDAGPTPISPIKRSKHDKELKDARRKSSYTSYSTSTAKGTSSKHSDDKHHHRRSRSPDRSESKHSSSRSHHGRRRRDSSSSPEDRHRSSIRKEYKAIEYNGRPASVQPSATNQLAVSYKSKADLFLSFINKGPDSERGVSINKALKRYHRERDVKTSEEKEEDDKDLWKSLRLRRNDRGEIVLFTA